ncbi:MAG: hypothetical protein K2X81_18310 [Candidatus Obscuribacterales bacterium]|nr:hypothetical protein [Candidatus Obscuribacterales bacterium]
MQDKQPSLRDRLIAALADAEQNADPMELDEIAFLLGSFPATRQRVWDCSDTEDRALLQNKPKPAKLVLEMDPLERYEPAFLQCTRARERTDTVGKVTDCFVRWRQEFRDNDHW